MYSVCRQSAIGIFMILYCPMALPYTPLFEREVRDVIRAIHQAHGQLAARSCPAFLGLPGVAVLPHHRSRATSAYLPPPRSFTSCLTLVMLDSYALLASPKPSTFILPPTNLPSCGVTSTDQRCRDPSHMLSEDSPYSSTVLRPCCCSANTTAVKVAPTVQV